MTAITVTPQGFPAYDVVVDRDVLPLAGELLKDCARVAVVHQESVSHVAATIAEVLRDRGIYVLDLVVPDGEQAKDIAVAVDCWDRLGAAGFTRSDAVIGVGGGAATDLAGFVAATWLRGVALVQVPTTTAGMVDAAIGGKTGVNTQTGKNLVGAFHQPRGVIADLSLLASLPIEHHRAGLAEVAKCGFIADPAILDLIEADPKAALDPTADVIAELVERAVRVKAEVVSDDTREAGRREILNYGHTLGHAIERAEHYRWRHGDAVAVGMIFAAALSCAAGNLDEATAERHRRVVELLTLPSAYRDATREDLLAAMRVDKKSRADRLRFVTLDALAKPAILDNPGPELLAAAFDAVGA